MTSQRACRNCFLHSFSSDFSKITSTLRTKPIWVSANHDNKRNQIEIIWLSQNIVCLNIVSLYKLFWKSLWGKWMANSSGQHAMTSLLRSICVLFILEIFIWKGLSILVQTQTLHRKGPVKMTSLGTSEKHYTELANKSSLLDKLWTCLYTHEHRLCLCSAYAAPILD